MTHKRNGQRTAFPFRQLFRFSPAALLLLLTACGVTGTAAQESSPDPYGSASPTVSESPDGTQTPPATPEGPDLSGFVQAVVKPSQTFQTIDGFGAGYTWYSDRMLHPKIADEIADLLFADAKMTILRFKNELGYQSDTIADNCREVQIYNLARERAEVYKEDVTVLMSCWSPPARLKSNGYQKGGGTLKKNEDGTYMYAEYGEWWADSVEGFQNAGLPIDYVSIQNECDFQVSYDGMELSKFETEKEASYAQAFLHTYDAFQSRFGAGAPLMLGPETMTCDPMALKIYLKDILDTRPQALAGIAHHLYAGGTSADTENGSTNSPNSFNLSFMDNYSAFGDTYPIWQTEFYRGTPLQTATLINNALVFGNLNAYIYWTGVWAGSAPNHNMINVDGSGYYYGSVYWVMRHYSEFIRPGYQRVQLSYPTTPGFRAAAFISPNRDKLAVVLVNPTAEDIEITLPVEDYTITESALYQSILADDAYDKGEYYNALGAMGDTIVLRAMSITTLDANLGAA